MARSFSPDCFMSAILHHLTDIGGAAVLPNDGVINRRAGGAVPDDCRFALVGDTDGKRRSAAPQLIHHRTGHTYRGFPNRLRVMLHPAILWKDLWELRTLLRQDGPVFVKQDGAKRGCTLVDGNNGSFSDMVSLVFLKMVRSGFFVHFLAPPPLWSQILPPFLMFLEV